MNRKIRLSYLGINPWKWQYLLILSLTVTLSETKKASSFDQSALERLRQTNSCRDCNLKGVNLTGANLMGANLEGANLQGANLQGANLENANLKKANLKGGSQPTILAAANLKNADLSDAKLRGAVLFKANLEGANLSHADLSIVLSRLLNSMSIHCTDLRAANLSGANLSHTNLRIKVPVGDRWMVHGGTPLKTEKICNPALLGANFSRANLKDAVLEGIELKQIVLCQTTMPDGSISNSNCPSELKNYLKISSEVFTNLHYSKLNAIPTP
ncbi:MAG: pentapeptide repeat-containing protein [Cyanobacteriota bacterium]